MNKQSKFSVIVLGVFFLLALCHKGTAQTGINRISKEQKLYELSVIWKELSYNFANKDNCPNVNMDSLYRTYMTIVQNTKNDWEYCKALQCFLCHFNNGHVACFDIPAYFDDYLGRLLLKTAYKDNKVIVENIGTHNAKKVTIGDEIITVNDMPVMDYLQKEMIPYIAASNENIKIHKAMFGQFGITNRDLKDKKIKIGIKTPNGIKNVTLAYDYHLNPLPKDTAIQNKRSYLDTEASTHFISMRNNLFLEDTVHDFAFIRLTRCDDSFYSFFVENYEKIMQYKHLIVDIHYNEGGSSNASGIAIECLVNNDSIYTYSEKTRVNNALHKAWATTKIMFYEDSEVPDFHKINYYPYYYGTAFEDVFYNEGIARSCIIPDSLRYKGKVYVLISEDNGSAGEYFAAMLSQNKDIIFLGKKTIGAFGQPLVIDLPSGMQVMLNTTKTYDFHGRDISSGFPPNYEYDFSEIYKITDPQEMLNKLIEVIKGVEE